MTTAIRKPVPHAAPAAALACAVLCAAVCSADQPVQFGVVADVQYANKGEAGGRGYGGSLGRLADCVSNFNSRPLAFVIELGDIIDGYPQDSARSRKDLGDVLGVFRQFRQPCHAVIGNHCLTTGTNTLAQAFGVPTFHYEFTVAGAKGWRFIVLDGTDAGYGILSSTQIAWFRATLERAKARGERVLCFCHFALLKEAAADFRLAQPEPVLEAICAAGNVAAWFAGHEHNGGYVFTNGVHHVTFKAMVESPSNAYAVVGLEPARIRVTGFGREESRTLELATPLTRLLEMDSERRENPPRR